jgi:hypothetical protein
LSNLLHFLTNLATNPRQQEVFKADPNTVMELIGLSQLERTAIKSNNPSLIAASFVNKSFQASLTVFDPAPDPLPDPDPPQSPPEEIKQQFAKVV